MNLLEQTQQQIEKMILNKEYDENNYLPSEGELCKKFEVSRATVREAVRSMEVRGFLKRVHGKGLQVIDNSVKVMTRSIADMISLRDCDLSELIEVRRIIEVEAARLAADRADEQDLEQLRKSLAVMENTEVMDDNYYHNDLEFHVNLVKASKNNMLSAIVSAYTPLLGDVVVASSQTNYCIERRHHFHRDVYDCIVKREPDAAAEKMRIHLRATSENVETYQKNGERK